MTLVSDIENMITGNHLKDSFNDGPDAIYTEFKTYEEVWFLKKKNCESHPKCS